MSTTITVGPRWTVTLNHIDGDCDTMPFTFDTEAEAEAYGAAWVAGDIDGDATYWTTKVDSPSYQAQKFGGRWICDGPNGRFHAKTKAQLVEMLKNDGEVNA